MSKVFALTGGLLFIVMVGMGPPPGEQPDAAQVVKLKFQALTEKDSDTPNPKIQNTEGRVTVGTTDVVLAETSANLSYDRDGDGQAEAPIRKDGIALLDLKGEGGAKKPYALLFRKAGKVWSCRGAASMVGKVKGVTVQLIDENLSGTYNDAGTDAIRVGNEYSASLLGKVISVKDEVYTIDVKPDGSEIALKPYRGETGYLDMSSGFHSKGKLFFAVVTDGEGTYFNVARPAKLKVPVGTYKLQTGRCGYSATVNADILPGDMGEIEVTSGKETRVEWGAPGKLEFEMSKAGRNFTINVASIRILGASKELYRNFRPKGFAPNIEVRDQTGRLLKSMNLGVGC